MIIQDWLSQQHEQNSNKAIKTNAFFLMNIALDTPSTPVPLGLLLCRVQQITIRPMTKQDALSGSYDMFMPALLSTNMALACRYSDCRERTPCRELLRNT